jgi:hypothetical protein
MPPLLHLFPFPTHELGRREGGIFTCEYLPLSITVVHSSPESAEPTSSQVYDIIQYAMSSNIIHQLKIQRSRNQHMYSKETESRTKPTTSVGIQERDQILRTQNKLGRNNHVVLS